MYIYFLDLNFEFFKNIFKELRLDFNVKLSRIIYISFVLSIITYYIGVRGGYVMLYVWID